VQWPCVGRGVEMGLLCFCFKDVIYPSLQQCALQLWSQNFICLNNFSLIVYNELTYHVYLALNILKICFFCAKQYAIWFCIPHNILNQPFFFFHEQCKNDIFLSIPPLDTWRKLQVKMSHAFSYAMGPWFEL
jgi:hypothetical protein